MTEILINLPRTSTMKKVIALLFVGSVLTFAACQSKPKTEEAAVDSTAAALDSSAAAADTSATADSTKK